MDIEEYKKDESLIMRGYKLSEQNDLTAKLWREQLLEKRGLDDVHVLMSAVGKNMPFGTCLDVGMSYGALFFGFEKFYPEIKWSGCDIYYPHIEKAKSLLAENQNPSMSLVPSYDNLSIYADNSFDFVFSCSMLTHYSPEHAFKIIDEMLRVAKNAVIIKFYQVPQGIDDEYILGHANMAGRGYFVVWSLPKWLDYIKNKKVEWASERVCILKK